MASIILPTSTTANITALASYSMTQEADVNGVWNAIFNHWFPTGALANAIKPEANFGGFIDLLVTRQIFEGVGLSSPWRVVFEGKASNGDTFERISSQLQGYAASLATGVTCYAIGARGRRCMFWKFKKGDSNAMKGIKVERGAVVISEDGHFPAAEYDVATNAVEIQIILTYIQANT